MPNQPYLDPLKTKVDGLAFLGLSLSRSSPHGHPSTVTHQESFDLNDVTDRQYEFVMSSNDDGWLVGGGEPGPPNSYKLAARDSAHVEIMRIGTYEPDWGGVREKDVVDAIQSGQILIPQIDVLPTAVVANPDAPPELEIRFDMLPPIPNLDDLDAPLPINWQLRFIHNQLFKHFVFPSRFCPGPFHSTILRKADWRSPTHKRQYFEKCQAAIQKWRSDGPKPLNTGWNIDGTLLNPKPEHGCSGIYLFTDRNTISHYFPPNFVVDSVEKKKMVLDVLREEWDADDLEWKAAGSVDSWKPVVHHEEEREPDADAAVDA